MSDLLSSSYPDVAWERDQWILARRGARHELRADRPYAFLLEQERFATGEVGSVATIFLTNRECPWRCAMCDLWKNTLTASVPPGAIPAQIEFALSRLPPARHIKLYNSGSFFDPRAIAPGDYKAIATLVRGFERVIVECHPALLGERCLGFHQLLGTELEVAVGLETVHPGALEKLNKRMTLAQFRDAADWLKATGIALRTFLLVSPPFIPPEVSALWTQRSLDCAMRCGATAITLIATRAGNGAVEQLTGEGEFHPPTLRALEDALIRALAESEAFAVDGTVDRPRVFADLWELERTGSCQDCLAERIAHLRRMNETQCSVEGVRCARCEELA